MSRTDSAWRRRVVRVQDLDLEGVHGRVLEDRLRRSDARGAALAGGVVLRARVHQPLAVLPQLQAIVDGPRGPRRRRVSRVVRRRRKEPCGRPARSSRAGPGPTYASWLDSRQVGRGGHGMLSPSLQQRPRGSRHDEALKYGADNLGVERSTVRTPGTRGEAASQGRTPECSDERPASGSSLKCLPDQRGSERMQPSCHGCMLAERWWRSWRAAARERWPRCVRVSAVAGDWNAERCVSARAQPCSFPLTPHSMFIPRRHVRRAATTAGAASAHPCARPQ